MMVARSFGEGKAKSYSISIRVSVMEEDKVLGICCTAMCVELAVP